MSGVSWIKVRTDIFSDEKIRLIEHLPEADSILVIWVKLLALAGQKNAGGEIFINDEMPYTDELLAAIFHRKVNTVRLALSTFEKFRMIEIASDQTIVICNWAKHQNIEGMEKIRQQNLERKQKQRRIQSERRLLSRDSHVTLRDAVTQNSVTSQRQNREEEEEKKEIPEIIVPTATVMGESSGSSTEEGIQYHQAKIWLNELFGSKERWNYEEDHLLNELVPIPAEAWRLIDWAYRLPRDHPLHELTKLKQSRLALLREFGLEIDKIQWVRKQMGYGQIKAKKPLEPDAENSAKLTNDGKD